MLEDDYGRKLKESQSSLDQMKAELEEALRAKDEFLATVSHEIRTPLHSIINAVQRLLLLASQLPGIKINSVGTV